MNRNIGEQVGSATHAVAEFVEIQSPNRQGSGFSQIPLRSNLRRSRRCFIRQATTTRLLATRLLTLRRRATRVIGATAKRRNNHAWLRAIVVAAETFERTNARQRFGAIIVAAKAFVRANARQRFRTIIIRAAAARRMQRNPRPEAPTAARSSGFCVPVECKAAEYQADAQQSDGENRFHSLSFQVDALKTYQALSARSL